MKSILQRALMWLGTLLALLALGHMCCYGQIGLTGNVKLPNASNFNGTLNIKLTHAGVKNICSTPSYVVPTSTSSYKITNGVLAANASTAAFVSQDCMNIRYPYYVEVADNTGYVVANDNWYLPNLVGGVVNIGNMEDVGMGSGPIIVAIPSAIISSPQSGQTINNSMTFTGTVNFNGTVNYATPPAFTIVKATQLLVNGVISSGYGVDVNGGINSSAGYCVASCSTATVGQALVFNGSYFVPGTPTVPFPNQFYQTVVLGTSAQPQQSNLQFDANYFLATNNAGLGQTQITLVPTGVAASTYTQIASLTVNVLGQITAITTSGSTIGTATNVTGSRTCSTVYQNITGYSLAVNVSHAVAASSGATMTAYVGLTSSPTTVAAVWSSVAAGSGTAQMSATFTVPAGSYYYVVRDSGCGIANWTETTVP